ncbi:hypothetical protein GGI08_008535, partial [Coemansia sp. S2]
MEYYASGLILSAEQITQITRPIMKMVKHGHGVPSTMPDDYFHMRDGARIPRLADRLDGRNMEMTMRMLNGQGSEQFAILGLYLQIATAHHHKYVGDFLDYPHTVPPKMRLSSGNKPSIGPTWLPYIAGVLQNRAVNIRVPRHLGDRDTRIHSAFTKPPTHEFWEESSKANRNITHITDLFYLVGERVEVKGVGRRGWIRHIANDVGQQQCDRRQAKSTKIVDLAHVKAALNSIQQQFGTVDHLNRDQTKESYRWQRDAKEPERGLCTDFVRERSDVRRFRIKSL